MPFNKGDFTQQGVAGHVNANLRLNEKRLVNIDLTTNEDAEGCTIAGTVKDLLNDKVYNIGTAPAGNIQITENGENINVAQYATATVNVSGEGLPFFTATIVNGAGVDMSATRDLLEKGDYGVIMTPLAIAANSTEVRDYLYCITDDIYYVPLFYSNVPSGNALITYSDLVNCTVDEEEGGVLITDPSENSSATLTLAIPTPDPE